MKCVYRHKVTLGRIVEVVDDEMWRGISRRVHRRLALFQPGSSVLFAAATAAAPRRSNRVVHGNISRGIILRNERCNAKVPGPGRQLRRRRCSRTSTTAIGRLRRVLAVRRRRWKAWRPVLEQRGSAPRHVLRRSFSAATSSVRIYRLRRFAPFHLIRTGPITTSYYSNVKKLSTWLDLPRLYKKINWNWSLKTWSVECGGRHVVAEEDGKIVAELSAT